MSLSQNLSGLCICTHNVYLIKLGTKAQNLLMHSDDSMFCERESEGHKNYSQPFQWSLSSLTQVSDPKLPTVVLLCSIIGWGEFTYTTRKDMLYSPFLPRTASWVVSWCDYRMTSPPAESSFQEEISKHGHWQNRIILGTPHSRNIAVGLTVQFTSKYVYTCSFVWSHNRCSVLIN